MFILTPRLYVFFFNVRPRSARHNATPGCSPCADSYFITIYHKWYFAHRRWWCWKVKVLHLRCLFLFYRTYFPGTSGIFPESPPQTRTIRSICEKFELLQLLCGVVGVQSHVIATGMEGTYIFCHCPVFLWGQRSYLWPYTSILCLRIVFVLDSFLLLGTLAITSVPLFMYLQQMVQPVWLVLIDSFCWCCWVVWTFWFSF